MEYEQKISVFITTNAQLKRLESFLSTLQLLIEDEMLFIRQGCLKKVEELMQKKTLYAEEFFRCIKDLSKTWEVYTQGDFFTLSFVMGFCQKKLEMHSFYLNHKMLHREILLCLDLLNMIREKFSSLKFCVKQNQHCIQTFLGHYQHSVEFWNRMIQIPDESYDKHGRRQTHGDYPSCQTRV